MNNSIKRNLIFSTICILVLISIFSSWYYIDQKNKAYKNIYLEFKTIETEYELGKKIDPISFILKTNAEDIGFPTIDPKTIGEHTYVYVARDCWGNQKEFILKLKFVDPIKPVLILTSNYVEITEGDSIDFNSFVKEAYDEIDGQLKVEIDVPDTLGIGEYEIIYRTSDKQKNMVTATLKLKVNARPVEVEIPDNSTTKDDLRKGSKTENPKNEVQNTPHQNYPVKIPLSKVFTISEYGSIANAEFNAKKYGQTNCPDGYSWYCSPYSDDDGIIVGYQVIFK